MTILLTDPRVTQMGVHDNGEPLVELPSECGPARARVRQGLAQRLQVAAWSLPDGIGLDVVEGYRSPSAQEAIIASYAAQVRAEYPQASSQRIAILTSRFVAPLQVAPHVAGAAIDVTLVDRHGERLDMGTEIDQTPEQSQNRCYFNSADVGALAQTNRAILAAALGRVGLINYPTEWWHWSYGDRYWALMTGAEAALYGPVTPTLHAA